MHAVILGDVKKVIQNLNQGASIDTAVQSVRLYHKCDMLF